MGNNVLYNILMYSHDTYGLGHIRRTMAIAGHLRDTNTNVLILTGSPIAGRFTFPENVDFVRIPGMIKKTNNEYHSLSIRIDPEHALRIRRDIIMATAKTFQPDLFIVDKEPLGLRKEVLPTLQWLRQSRPKTQTVLGLRDIMDDRETVRNDWRKKNVYSYLEELYSEIWVYGEREIYDAAIEYEVPESVRTKMHFTGYLPREVPSRKEVNKIRRRCGVKKDEKLIVVTAGGGGDGFKMMDTYLKMVDKNPLKGTKSSMITGPFMPKDQRRRLMILAKKNKIKLQPFFPYMEKMFGAADLVVSMGGYNTMCEILSQQTPCLIIPRETPRLEQLIRARALEKQKLVDYLPWSQLTPDHLAEKITPLLTDLDTYKQSISHFRLRGIDSIKKRLALFREQAQ